MKVSLRWATGRFAYIPMDKHMATFLVYIDSSVVKNIVIVCIQVILPSVK